MARKILNTLDFLSKKNLTLLFRKLSSASLNSGFARGIIYSKWYTFESPELAIQQVLLND